MRNWKSFKVVNNILFKQDTRWLYSSSYILKGYLSRVKNSIVYEK